jgi:hypothetical protein
MSRFVVFCRDVASFFGAQKCDMTCAKQDPSGDGYTIKRGFNRRWTQMDADKNGTTHKIRFEQKRTKETKNFRAGASYQLRHGAAQKKRILTTDEHG